jgi:hypothetical protein
MYQGPVAVLPSTSTAVGAALLFTDNIAFMTIGLLMAVFGIILIGLQLVTLARSRRPRARI